MNKQGVFYIEGLQVGALTAFPVLLLAEHIRYGFVSNWMPLWAPVVLLGLVLWLRAVTFSYITRLVLFIEYSLISIVLMMRISEQMWITVIGCIGVLLGWFLVFSVAERGKISEHTHV